MVSDVMGHGAEAALLTMLLKAVFHDTALVVSDPRSLLSEMSRRLRRLIPDGTFVASAIARLTPGSSEVEVANAGLPYPFILRAKSGRVDEVQLGGIPLGIPLAGATPTYQIRRVELEPRDVLLIASDGIGTVQDGGGRYFGDGRLGETMSRLPGLTGKEAIEEILADAVAFSAGRPFEDDVNLIAVSRETGAV
jgi:sigma-B regulation protein RsbU (phosphoserine phosphatase)